MMVQHETPVPVVSVIITTNNRKAWVVEALESVFAQTYSDYEVIVVDDGSKDGTFEHLQQRFGEHIRLFKTEGTNCPTARNYGAEQALGRYLAFLDDDDRWYPQKLEKQVAFMEASGTQVGMVGSACDHMNREGQPIWKPAYPDAELTYERACIKPKLPGAISGCLIRTAVFRELDGFDLGLTRNQDRDLWIRLTRRYRVPMLQEVLSTVRIHGTQRRGVNTDTIEQCRLMVNQRIPERLLRRKADAWTYFHLFNLNWDDRKPKAIQCLLKSFWAYPAPLPIPEQRIKIALRRLLGRH
ncbi:glycosyltransferase family 2 protein [Marinimicrobium sp. ARAG 43.8]|uniref:glycosyltransferase family 2 protein n=1 Tax=Marinimicrobium sp. ARAG 43.8 TaxID=3418719 RepID=UPI003CF17419